MVMGELAQSAQVVVVGAGPGGYVAAIRLAQLGKEVTLIDKAEIGGICLNHGCIPSKALIHVADMVSTLKEVKELGITTGTVRINPNKLDKWKNDVVKKLTSGVAQLLEHHKVTLIKGTAKFESSSKIRVTTSSGTQILQFEHAVIATGSSPVEIKGFAFDGKKVWSSRHALDLDSIPKKMVVIGGGYIGLELGTVYQKLGSLVTIVQRGDRIAPYLPSDVTDVVKKRMESLGVKFLLNASASSLKKNRGCAVTVKVGGKSKVLSSDVVLVCVGRRPNTSGLGLRNTNVEVDERGFVKKDGQMRTNDSRIFAIGDVAGQPMLAHKASHEAKVAAEVICGKKSAFDNVVPSVMFTDPEIAIVGLDEEEAKKAGHEIVVGTFPFSASGRAMTMNLTSGFLTLVCDKATNLLLGARIVGPHASDLIGELTLAVEMGATAEDLALTIHVHPTFGEVIQEAAEDVLGEAIHRVRK